MFKQFFSALEILEETKSSQRVFDYVEGLDEFDRDPTFKKVAKYFARAGRADEALRFSAAIRGPENQLQLKDRDATFLFFSLSVGFHDADEPDETLALLRSSIGLAKAISGGIHHSKFLWGCASLLARWNYPEEAKAVAEDIKIEWFRSRAIREITKS